MKVMYTLLLLVGLSPLMMAQSNQVDPRLVDALGQETIDYLSDSNPFLIEYQTVQLDHLWEIKEFPEGKLEGMTEINLKRSELKNPNILVWIKKFKLTRAKDYHTYYRIGRTNNVLILYSEDHFAQKFNELTGRSH